MTVSRTTDQVTTQSPRRGCRCCSRDRHAERIASSIEALERLEQRASELAGSVVMTDAIARAAVSSVVGRASVLELEYQRALADAELGWLRTIVDDLRSGRLDWNNEEKNFDVGSTIEYPAAGGTR